jgi:hypothetical protein
MTLLTDDRPALDYSNFILFGISVIAILVFFLTSIVECDAKQFCTTTIFLTTGTISFLMLVVLGILVKKIDLREGKLNSIEFFYMQRLTLWKLGLVPIGLGLVFLVSFIAVENNSPIAGIAGSGIIMMTIFFLTSSVAIPILIHGFYNAIVVYLRSGTGNTVSGLATSPINVPEIGYTLFNQDLLIEMATQILLVAPSEELLKTFMVAFFMIVLSLKWAPTWSVKIVSGLLSVGVWATYHTVIAV